MKRWIAIAFVLLLALTIAGCKRDDNNVHNEGNTPTLRSEEAVLEGDAITELSEAVEATEGYVPEAPSLRSEEAEEKAVNTTAPQLKSEPIPEGDGNVLSNASEYTALIHDLKSVVQYRLKPNYSMGEMPPVSKLTQKAIDFNEENKYKWECMVGELPDSPEAENADYYGYILHDLDKDGKPELFFVRNDHSIAAVFTIYNGKVVLLDAYWSRYSGYVTETGELYASGSGGAAYHTLEFFTIKNGKLFTEYSYYSDLDSNNNPIYYQTNKDGLIYSISKETYDEYLSAYNYGDCAFWNSIPVQKLY